MSRLEQITRMLENEPDDVFLNFSLAMEYRSAGEIEKAMAQFDRVITLDPAYLAAYMRKGETLMNNRQFDEARAALEQGVAVAKDAGDQHMLDNINEMLDMLP
ncbi:MAG: tetratricopeptide repeat protein [Phycisphaerales bacterium]|nr:tetratricopeptide repeat protein [Phycisphaerales bacterium]